MGTKMNEEKFKKLIEQEKKDGRLVNTVTKAVIPFFAVGAAMFIPEILNPNPYFSQHEFSNLTKIGVGILAAGGIPFYATAVYFTARTIYRDDLCKLQEEKMVREIK